MRISSKDYREFQQGITPPGRVYAWGDWTAIEMPYPPSVNNYYLRTDKGGEMISPAGVRFREQVAGILLIGAVQPLAGKITMHVELYPPNAAWRDIDNPLKALLDALQHGGAFANDRFVKQLIVDMLEPIDGGKCVVKLKAWEAE